jgi:biotin carboxylase
MKEKVLILLGGNILNNGIVQYCKSHDIFIVVVDWSPNACLKGDLFLCIDVKDHKQIIEQLEAHGIHSIIGTYTSIDLAVESLNAINAHYGLKHMDNETLHHALPKALMTSIWKKNDLLNRWNDVFDEYDTCIFDFNENNKIIIKPNISSSSRGITILPKGSKEEMIKSAFLKAREESFDKRVIVEEFVEGREFTCEMLGDSRGEVSVYAISVKYHTENTVNNRIAIKLHYNSSYYPENVYEKIAAFGKKCYKALGLKASLGHLELIMKEDGSLSPVEIGARSSGLIVTPLAAEASEHDFFGDYLRVLQGGLVSGNDYINSNTSTMYFFYDMPHGTTVVNPCSIMDFLPETIKSIYCNREKVLTQGYHFSDIASDNDRVGYEILAGSKNDLTIQVVENAEKDFVKHCVSL